MKVVQENFGDNLGTEHYVLTLDSEIVKIHFGKQIDDLLISSPDGEVLISWDVENWDDTKCLLIKSFDNLKELNNLRCTNLLLKNREPKNITVYCTVQRN